MVSFRRRSGFTLIEILIVVGIIILLAMVSIPKFLRTRMTANEASAMASSRLIYNACQAYYEFSSGASRAYPSQLTDLVTPVSDPPYIDSTLSSGTKQGYDFVYTLIDNQHFTLRANPVQGFITGNRYYYVDETGIITAKQGEEAGPGDPPI